MAYPFHGKVFAPVALETLVVGYGSVVRVANRVVNGLGSLDLDGFYHLIDWLALLPVHIGRFGFIGKADFIPVFDVSSGVGHAPGNVVVKANDHPKCPWKRRPHDVVIGCRQLHDIPYRGQVEP